VLQLSWGKLRREPATRWFDESFAPIPKSHERFARQYRYDLPPEFPLASACSGIDHHLSGPNIYALTQIIFCLDYRSMMHVFAFFKKKEGNNVLTSKINRNSFSLLSFRIFLFMEWTKSGLNHLIYLHSC